MTADCQIQASGPSEKSIPERLRQARALDSFELASGFGMSQRAFAETIDVPRSTLQDWLERRDDIDTHPAVAAFFESEPGLAILHRIVLASQLVITLASPGGIRQVCLFLRLSGLSSFVGSSYGVQQEAITLVEEELGRFGKQEQERLGKEMRPKDVSLVEDETFHPETCLVAVEPVSNYVLLEAYAADRTEKTWNERMKGALAGLPVKVVQSTSDEAVALINHEERGLEAHHSPDLFHVQHEVLQATALPMESRKREAEKALEKASEERRKWEELDRGHPSELLAGRIEDARAEEKSARGRLGELKEERERMLHEIRGIAWDYHPFDLETGAERSGEVVFRELEERFSTIHELARREMLSEECHGRIEKAHRVVPKMVATIVFVLALIRSRVEALGLPETLESLVLERWVPGRYVELVAGKARSSEERQRLREQASKILPSKEERENVLRELRADERSLILAVVEECAVTFQRSSSCGEGRNGELELYRHGHHRLTPRKLTALTVIHNYQKERPDGTTAAERFFGVKPRNMFEHLLAAVLLPKRPRTRALRKAQGASLPS